MEAVIPLDAKEHAFSLMNGMENLQKEKQHCDFMIKVGSVEIPAHKSVLASSSGYFKAMLSHENVETRSNMIELKDVDPESVRKCINFIYTGEAAVSEEKRGAFMHVAHMLQLDRLCEGLGQYLEHSMDAKTFFDTKTLANTYNCTALEEKCDEFALQNFENIAGMEGFKHLDQKYVSFLLTSKESDVSESFKCDVLIKWTEHDVKNRAKYFSEMLGMLDLSKIPLTYRRFLVENGKLIYDSVDCLRKLTVSILDSGNVKGRNYKTEQSMNALAVFDLTSKALMSFDPKKQDWNQMVEMNEEIKAQTNFSGIVLDDDIYVLLPDKSAFRLNFVDQKNGWVQIADRSMNSQCGAVLDGYIYATDFASINMNVERYDPIKNKWKRIPDKRSQTIHSTFSTDGKCLFSIGGKAPNNAMTTNVERFDPTSSSWSNDKPINKARYMASSAEVNGKIYLLGGQVDRTVYQNNQQSMAGSVKLRRSLFSIKEFTTTQCTRSDPIRNVEYRDPETGAWTTIADMSAPRHRFSTCVLGGKIFAVGGDNTNTAIEMFDVRNNEWEQLNAMTEKNIVRRASVAIRL